ncbi:MAG TPA: hypothetical protein PLY05_13460 [Agitococcus sp.]|jgi:hypothetical protein|nr:hypothetical protein [Agitococcus sp.]
MSVSPADLLAKNYKAAQALGQKEAQCDAYFEIEGFENLKFLAKTFPRPILASAGVIESYTPNGVKVQQPQQLQVAQSHEVSFYATKGGAVEKALMQLNNNGGTFQATVHLGQVDSPYASYQLTDCFLAEISPLDQDVEGVGQHVMISGTLYYHYFGERTES